MQALESVVPEGSEHLRLILPAVQAEAPRVDDELMKVEVQAVPLDVEEARLTRRAEFKRLKRTLQKI